MGLIASLPSGALQFGRVERLESIDIADRLGLLVPFEVAQRDRLWGEVDQQKAVFLDRRDGFLHVEMLRRLRANAAKFRRPPPRARAQRAREHRDYRIAREIELATAHHSSLRSRMQVTADHKRNATRHLRERLHEAVMLRQPHSLPI